MPFRAIPRYKGEDSRLEKTLKIGLIGTGRIANNAHMAGYHNMQNVEIVACCDIDEPKARDFAQRHGIPKVYTDYRDVLALPGLDAVDICTPNYLHAPMAVDALQKGLNVFCEKPDAVSVSEAERMARAARESGKVLMVMRNNRYLPAAQYLKKYIDDGRMGGVYAARCGWQRRRGIPGRGGWFTTKALSGGGPLIDLGVHMIDLTMWLMGSPTPVTVSGCAYDKIASKSMRETAAAGTFDVEDLAMGFIRFDTGACLQLEFSWASNIERDQRFFELRGEQSGACWSSIDDKLKVFTQEYGHAVDLYPNVPINKNEGIHESNLRHFADVLLNGAQPMFVPQQGVDMVKILEALYQSAREGHEIQL